MKTRFANPKIQLQHLILESTKRVPKSINAASIEATRRWVALIEEARKLATNERASLAQLQSIYQQLLQHK